MIIRFEVIFLAGGPWKLNVDLEKSLNSPWKMFAIFAHPDIKIWGRRPQKQVLSTLEFGLEVMWSFVPLPRPCSRLATVHRAEKQVTSPRI